LQELAKSSRHASLAAPWIFARAAHCCGPRLLQAEEATRASRLAGRVSARPPGATLKRLIADHSNVQALMAGLAKARPSLGAGAGGSGTAGDALGNRPRKPPRRYPRRQRPRAGATQDEAVVMRCLRRMKAEASLLIALCDIGGVWPVMRVTRRSLQLADAAVDGAVRHLLPTPPATAGWRRSNRQSPRSGQRLHRHRHGKMGAGELNYSSDIDLIVFYDSAAPELSQEPSPFSCG